MQIPIISLTPIKSLEQICPLLLFLGMPILEYVERQRIKRNLGVSAVWMMRIKLLLVAGVIAVSVLFYLGKGGYLGKVTARVAGLFMKHTKTGNPLVDSVAEHQAASPQAYHQYLQSCILMAPAGLAILVIIMKFNGRRSAKIFMVAYATITYYFSARMVRLIIFLGPVASILTGVFLGVCLHWCFLQFLSLPYEYNYPNMFDYILKIKEKTDECKSEDKGKKGTTESIFSEEGDEIEATDSFINCVTKGYNSFPVRIIRKLVAVFFVYQMYFVINDLDKQCEDIAHQHSSPTIVFSAQLRNGQNIIVTDYLDTYLWIKNNTPRDARIMSWWDYGYQINGIANRTTIADGNTWNHEHIATLARCLVSNEKDAHRMIRHLADYVLVWSGGGGDDLAKSPHMARIGTSVYKHICPNDPGCSMMGYMQGGQPSPMMAGTLLYRLVTAGNNGNPDPDPNRFSLVYQSKYDKVRIYRVNNVSQKSKEWLADPKNRICDKGSDWICRGQYPPALNKFISEMRRFEPL